MNNKYEHVDLTYLEDMSNGNTRVMVEMIEIFNSQVPELISKMKEYLQEENWDALSRLAHKAKASAFIMGMTEVAADLKLLEISARTDKKGEKNFRFIVADLEKRFEFAMEELKNIATKL